MQLTKTARSADQLVAHRDQAGNVVAAWVENENGAWQLRGWSSIAGGSKPLAEYHQPIEILQVHSRGGLPTVFWCASQPGANMVTRMSDATTLDSRGGIEIFSGKEPICLAGQTCFAYWTEFDGKAIETQIHLPDGDISRVVIDVSSDKARDFKLVEGQRGDVTLFYVEEDRGESRIRALPIHGQPGFPELRQCRPDESEIIVRSEKKQLRIIGAADSPDGPACVLYETAPDPERMMKLRSTPGIGAPSAPAELKVAASWQ